MSTRSIRERAEEILGIDITVLGNRYAYYAEETGEWYWLTKEDLKTAIRLSKSQDEDLRRDIYSHWCTCTGQRISDRYVKANLQ